MKITEQKTDRKLAPIFSKIAFMKNDQILDNEKINEWRWQIVATRDAKFDGAFYTAVRSTGIYCKPSCSARRPKPENVTFFASREAARQAGFRACLRCRPDLCAPENPQVKLVQKVCEMIAINDQESISLQNLSEACEVSPSHLQRTFKQVLGVSPKEFSDAQKLENFKRQVKETNVTTALYESGFNSSRALYEKATANLGMTPSAYRQAGRNMQIDFTIVACDFGKLLIAATGKGVCSIKLGETAEELEANLKTEFSAAKIERDDRHLLAFVKIILENLRDPQKLAQLPLDLQATAFQLRVWTELRKIPFGETRSYQQIAAQIGNPKAVRAVARACASNPLALVTPCHRVIGADGNLSGYRWGINRKKQILETEKLRQDQKQS